MSRTRLLATGLVGAALLVAAACSADDGSEAASTSVPSETPSTTTRPAGPAPSAGCDATPVLPPGTADDTMRSGGQERHYQLVLPADYDGREPLPLVFALHALTVPYGVTPSIDGLLDEAATRDFVIVAPSGLLDAGTPYWLAAPVEPNYDVDFLGTLLDRLEADVCFDTSQVFSTGQSNGAQMSSLLACRMDDRITAVAPVDGVEFNDETCTGDPVPVMAFHGDADPVVTYEGGGLNATAIANQQYWKGDVPDRPASPRRRRPGHGRVGRPQRLCPRAGRGSDLARGHPAHLAGLRSRDRALRRGGRRPHLARSPRPRQPVRSHDHRHRRHVPSCSTSGWARPRRTRRRIVSAFPKQPGRDIAPHAATDKAVRSTSGPAEDRDQGRARGATR